MPDGEDGRGRIPDPVIPSAGRLLGFSFRHLDNHTEKFAISNCTHEFFCQLLQTIHEFSSWTIEQFCEQNNQEKRHVIWFPDTTEPAGFSHVDPEQLGYHDSWQFQLSDRHIWRVHGILIDDTFYIVWLDPDHRLYPR